MDTNEMDILWEEWLGKSSAVRNARKDRKDAAQTNLDDLENELVVKLQGERMTKRQAYDVLVLMGTGTNMSNAVNMVMEMDEFNSESQMYATLSHGG